MTAWINSRNYVVTEGHYRIGPHIGRNLADYLIALYVGRHTPLEYGLSPAIPVLLLVRGSREVRTWTVWMLIALAPVLPFAWGTSSRYLYGPSIPFSWLVAAGLIGITSLVQRLLGPSRPSRVAAGVLLAVLAVF